MKPLGLFPIRNCGPYLKRSPIEGTIRSRMKRGRTLLQKALWIQARDAGLIRDQEKKK